MQKVRERGVQEVRCSGLCARGSCTVFFEMLLCANSVLFYEVCKKVRRNNWSSVFCQKL